MNTGCGTTYLCFEKISSMLNLKNGPRLDPPPLSTDESLEVQLEAGISEDGRHTTIIASIADINTRIDILGSALDERMSRIESKMDDMITEMKVLLIALSSQKSKI